MNKDYQKRLIELVKELRECRDTTICNDYIFLSKLDHLIGYILALEKLEELRSKLEK